MFRVAISRQEVGTQALHRDEHDVAALGLKRITDDFSAFPIQSGQPAIQGFALLRREHRVEPVILQTVASERYHEIAGPVLLQLGDILIPARQRVGEHRHPVTDGTGHQIDAQVDGEQSGAVKPVQLEPLLS